jgi:hypothetical protein
MRKIALPVIALAGLIALVLLLTSRDSRSDAAALDSDGQESQSETAAAEDPEVSSLQADPPVANAKVRQLLSAAERAGEQADREAVEQIRRQAEQQAEIDYEAEAAQAEAAQKRIFNVFKEQLVEKLRPCYSQLPEGSILFLYKFVPDGNGNWTAGPDALEIEDSKLPEAVDEKALGCMRDALTDVRFPQEEHEQAWNKYAVYWNWRVPFRATPAAGTN